MKYTVGSIFMCKNWLDIEKTAQISIFNIQTTQNEWKIINIQNTFTIFEIYTLKKID